MRVHFSKLRARDTQIAAAAVTRVVTSRYVALNWNSSIRSLFLMALLLTLNLPGWGAKYARLTHEIPFQLVTDHLEVVSGSLGDAKSRLLLIDTGTNPSVVDHETAQELGLQQVGVQSNQIVVMNGTAQTYSAVLPEMTLGPIRRQGLQVNVADLSGLRQRTGIHLDAVIGLDVLDQLKFQIDYSAKKIRFGDIRMAGTKVPLSESDNFLTVQA